MTRTNSTAKKRAERAAENEPERDADGRILNEYGLPIATEGIDFHTRPPRKRPKGWLAKAIKDGSVRDPKLGPNPPEEHSPTATIIRPGVMTASGENKGTSRG